MRVARLENQEGKKELVRCYTIDEFSVLWLDDASIERGGKKAPTVYLKTVATFDIETTSIKCLKPFGFMYLWTMVIDGYAIYGRTWREWLLLLDRLTDWLNTSDDRRLIIWIQNLAFETQFMKDFLVSYFGECEVFATDKRKPIKFFVKDKGLEFRCTYRLSNMNLEKMGKSELGCRYRKLVGDLDYSKLRTPETYITIQEFSYAVSDTYVLYDWVRARLKNNGDNFFTSPVTSTGYVRRDCRKATKTDRRYRQYFDKNKLTPPVYTMLKEAGRGGDTHANRHYAGRIMKGVDSYDETSAYIFALFRKYPISKFSKYGKPVDIEEFNNLKRKYCVLCRIILKNPRVKAGVAMPYIPIAKLQKPKPLGDIVNDNGRVLAVNNEASIYLTVTEIDLDIILKQYDYDALAIYDVYYAKRGYLPKCLREELRKYFYEKCELKIKIKKCEKKLEEAEASSNKEAIGRLKKELNELNYFYAKAKNRLNSIFGMMYTDPVRSIYAINEEAEWLPEEKPDLAEAIEKYNSSFNSFLVYAHGVYCTAWARLLLNQVVEATGTGSNLCLYCDTDSSKCLINDEEPVKKLNESIKKTAEEIGAFVDVEGERFYTGVLEKETKREKYKEFITLGAKKYAYTDSRGLHVTISGVVKHLAPKELKSLQNFHKGFVFKEAGGNTLYYNDEGIHTINIEGVEIETASNVAVLPSTYTLGLTSDYERILSIYGENF